MLYVRSHGRSATGSGQHAPHRLMASAVSEMREETYYVRDPRVHIGTCSGWIGDNPDNNQDQNGPANNLQYQWPTSRCSAK